MAAELSRPDDRGRDETGPQPDPAAPASARPSPPELESAARLGSGQPARARQAASVIVVREGSGELELLLVKRNPNARFMGGVWVFPGGAVDAGEGEGDRAHRAAAVRELAEEAGLGPVDPSRLVKFSRWITPVELAIRFDTHFYIAALPADQEPTVDGQECVEAAWLTAQQALDAHADGRILLVFPTIRQLEQLRGFATVEALLEHARGREIPTTRPRMVVAGGEIEGVVMPGEPGYDPG